MAQRFLYWVTFIIQKPDVGKLAIHGQFAEADGPLNSEGAVIDLIDSLTREHVKDPKPGTLPIVPISWQLISAQRGSAAKPERNGKRRKH